MERVYAAFSYQERLSETITALHGSGAGKRTTVAMAVSSEAYNATIEDLNNRLTDAGKQK